MTSTNKASKFVIQPSSSLLLDGNWSFEIDVKTKGESETWFSPTYDDSAWQIVSVPHTWNVMPMYSQHSGLAWYRYHLTPPSTMKDMHLRLRFQAVFYLTRIWVNGVFVGEHEGGYTPFEFDVSGLIKSGQDNVIAVSVDNKISMIRIPAELRPGWSFDWWNYGGIVRPVSIEATNPIYLSRQQITTVPNLTGIDIADQAEIVSNVVIINSSGFQFDGEVYFNIFEESTNKLVKEPDQGKPVSLAPGQSTTLKLSTSLDDPKLWHFDHPNLYLFSVSIKKDGQEIHTLESTFGIRSVEVKNGEMFLNGEAVRLVGITRHADSPEFGLAETVQIMAADYQDIKSINEVLTRPVHYPQSDYILDYADRHGILLIPEIPAWQLTADQMALQKMRDLEKSQLLEMITSEYNHPSIWAWSIGNEIESETPEGHAFVKEMISYVKTLDPTRPVGFASNRLNINPERDATAYADFVLMNQYWGGWAGPKQGLSTALDNIHAAWPDKTVIISEFGFEPSWNRLWGPATSSLSSEDYYFIPDGTPPDSDEADQQRILLIQEQMAVFRTKPFIAGAIFWTYQDYRTRTNFIMGIVDAERNKRASWSVLRAEYSPVLMDSFIIQQNKINLTLLTRDDLPAYTLRGYTMHWQITSPDGFKIFSEGDIPLPTLAPGSKWSSAFEYRSPVEEHVFTINILRPTGFSVIMCSYDKSGRLLP